MLHYGIFVASYVNILGMITILTVEYYHLKEENEV